MKKNIVILYTRLPGYFLECLKYFIRDNPNFAVFCICCKNSSDAPFIFEREPDIHIQYLEDLGNNIEQWVSDKSPVLIYSAGWSNKRYLEICKHYVSSIPVVLGMDSIWEGKWRQKVFTLFSKKFLLRYFNWLWVPGQLQLQYAKKLGFPMSRIRTNLYCCENYFNLAPNELTKSRYAPKNILFVGRFVSYKRPQLLARLFGELLEEGKANDWKLTLVGNGPLKEELLLQQSASGGSIEIHNFQQPDLLKDFLLKASIFCLPSINEHWGVVIHEAVSMGLPLLLSDSCGAGYDLLREGINGYHFKESNESDFKSKLALLMSLGEDRLLQMGEASLEISKTISQKLWSETLLEMINSK